MDTLSESQTHHLLLFGDQAVDELQLIRSLVTHSKTSPLARHFLRAVTDTVQIEYAQLSRYEHGWQGNIGSLLSLAEENSEREARGDKDYMVALVLTCIGRLGELIVHAERDPTMLGSQEKPVEVLAFCTGLFAAAAVVAARDTASLISLACHSVAVMLRFAYELRIRVLVHHEAHGPWSITYLGLEVAKVQEVLNEFHAAHRTRTPLKIAISIVSQGWLTLTGAPSSLALLNDFSAVIRKAPQMATDLGGPAHTEFLPQIDVDKVLGKSSLLAQSLDWNKVRMASPYSCKAYDHSTLGDMLREMIQGTAHEPLLINKTTRACVDRLDKNSIFRVTELGTMAHMPVILQALKAGRVKHSMNHFQPVASGEESDARRGGSDLVAIVGMAGRFPENDTIDGFWRDLLAGKCHIKKVPESRYRVDDYLDPTLKKKNSTAAQHGAWLGNPGFFDNRLFNISPREALQMDPTHRLFLTACCEALEMAGYSPDATPSMHPDRISTFYGHTGADWDELLQQQGMDIYYPTSLVSAFASGRVNYHFKFGGGSYAVDSACASSITGIHLACRSLLAREVDMALAGGASVLTSPNSLAGMSRSGMISTTGGCRTFHDDADGYARGEGIGVVVLKRLEDAVADKDAILGVIRGSARTYSSTSTSITHPSREAQERTYREVLQQSGLRGDEISYVEMHGTGTQAGDPEEMAGVLNVLANKPRAKDNPLTVGSVKAAVAHGEGAAGVTGLIKVLLMLQDRIVPRQPGVPFELNHNLPSPADFAKRNVRIALKEYKLRPSPKAADGKVKMLVNCFDASGGNSALVIQEAPDREARSAPDPRKCHIIALSGRSDASLCQNKENLLRYLDQHPDTQLCDLAYTTTARRIHYLIRAAYTGSSLAQIKRQLQRDLEDGNKVAKPAARKKPSVVFLFTGQGSQYAGMGIQLWRTSRRFRELLHFYQISAAHLGLPPFTHLYSDPEVDIQQATPTQVQLGIVALEIAVANTLRSWGIVPDAVVGHSLGEYPALCVAGVLSINDTLYLVGERAKLMEDKLTPHTHAMLAVAKMETGELRQEISKDPATAQEIDVACVNTPDATVLSGKLNALETLLDQLKARPEGVRSTLLRVPFGFHSSQVDPILDDFRAIASRVNFARPSIPVASTLLGKMVTHESPPTFSADYLARQARATVDFIGALKSLRQDGAGLVNDKTLWVELGPDPICLGMARKTLDLAARNQLPFLSSSPSTDNWTTVSALLATAYEGGININWPTFHKDQFEEDSLRLLHLPSYAFDYKDFWITYNQPPAWAATNLASDQGGKQEKGISPSPTLDFFPSTTLHSLESEDTASTGITCVFSSNTAEPALRDAIEGHVVNGHRIIPMGVLGDMALTAARYCYHRLHKNQDGKLPGKMVLRDVDMTKAIVLPAFGQKTQSCPTVLVQCMYKQDGAANGIFSVEFGVKNSDDAAACLSNPNGSCKVFFQDQSLLSPSSELFLLNSRIGQLKSMASSGQCHRLLNTVVYQLFSRCVAYGPNYRGMDEVLLPHDSIDAVATVRMPPREGLRGKFLADVYWHDVVTQLGGFVLNNGLRFRDTDDEMICIAGGFQEQLIFQELNKDTVYTTYVCMQEQPSLGSGVIVGDCHVFDDKGAPVQVIKQVRFQRMKKALLDHMLGVPGVPHVAPRRNAVRTGKKSIQASGHRSRKGENVQERSSHSGASTGIPTPREDGSDDDEKPGYSSSAVKAAEKNLLTILANEVGCAPEDLTDEVVLADMGVDSLMAMTVLAAVRNELGVELQASFFMENETVGAARKALAETLGEQSVHEQQLGGDEDEEDFVEIEKDKQSVQEPEHDVSVQENNVDVDDEKVKSASVQSFETLEQPGPTTPSATAPSTPTKAALPAARITHLQGLKTATTKLFLIADESGSALSYICLPTLGPDLGVYGIDWPLQADSLSSLVDACVAVISDHNGSVTADSILLGGLSLGAIVACKAAEQLLAEGDKLIGVLALDPPLDTEDIEARSLKMTAGSAGGMTPEGLMGMLKEDTEKESKGQEKITRHLSQERLVAIVPGTDTTAKRQGGNMSGILRMLAHDAQVRTLIATREKWMRFPAINDLGKLCQEAIAQWRGPRS